jgi:hypothetical protein
MPRQDDYLQALELGRESLKESDPDLLAGFANVWIERSKEGKTLFRIPFLNDKVIAEWPDFTFRSEKTGQEPVLQQQILLIHYLQGAWKSRGGRITGEWIAFQDLPDGRFYLDAFQRRAKIPLVQVFGEKPEKLVEIAGAAYAAEPSEQGDYSVVVTALPLVPLALILWKGDDEFPPEGNILFDRSITSIFSAEDVAWLSGMVVYPLAGMAGGK